MTHQYVIGDIVRLNQNILHAEIIGFKEATGSEGPLLHVQVGGTKMYFPVGSVTLVQSAAAAQASHPNKIETAVGNRDVTSLWDGGQKIHEPRKIET